MTYSLEGHEVQRIILSTDGVNEIVVVRFVTLVRLKLTLSIARDPIRENTRSSLSLSSNERPTWLGVDGEELCERGGPVEIHRENRSFSPRQDGPGE